MSLYVWSFSYRLNVGYYICFSPLGIFVALALRFDVSRGKDSQYFKSAFLGYAAGVVLTIIVMNWFQAAQVTIARSFLLYSYSYNTCRGKIPLLYFIAWSSLFFLLYFSACTFVYCTRCYWIFGCSLLMEWRSQTGLFITVIFSAICIDFLILFYYCINIAYMLMEWQSFL